jgi:hypothetical protein
VARSFPLQIIRGFRVIAKYLKRIGFFFLLFFSFLFARGKAAASDGESATPR